MTRVCTAPRYFVSPLPMEVVREVTKWLSGVYLPTGVNLLHQCFHQKHFLILHEQPAFHFWWHYCLEYVFSDIHGVLLVTSSESKSDSVCLGSIGEELCVCVHPPVFSESCLIGIVACQRQDSLQAKFCLENETLKTHILICQSTLLPVLKQQWQFIFFFVVLFFIVLIPIFSFGENTVTLELWEDIAEDLLNQVLTEVWLMQYHHHQRFLQYMFSGEAKK